MKSRATGILVAMVASVAMAASACSSSSRPDILPTPSSPDSVTVTRMDRTPSAHHVRFRRTFSDPKKVQALYGDLLDLPAAPTGTRVIACPAGFFVTYLLIFERRGRAVLSANADPADCQFVHLSNERVLRSKGGKAWEFPRRSAAQR